MASGQFAEVTYSYNILLDAYHAVKFFAKIVPPEIHSPTNHGGTRRHSQYASTMKGG